MKVLDKSTFSLEFERCCNQYSNLLIASAWCGDPVHVLPFSYLVPTNAELEIEAIIGVSYNKSHPDGIEFLIENTVETRIFKNESGMFHPKFYLFTSEKSSALFIGSSNFTFSGFFKNVEANILIEETAVNSEVEKIKVLFHKWKSKEYTLTPNKKWLKKYKKQYEHQRELEKRNKKTTPIDDEDSISSASWLSQASWDIYYKNIVENTHKKGREESSFNNVLDAAQRNLVLPLDPTIFDEIENRRIIGGMGDYALLGHVAASGGFRGLMANGSFTQKETVVSAINNICTQELPLNIKNLKEELYKLTDIGPTIKVWSRVLTILRPDIFVTVSSPSVRVSLSQTLEIPKTHLVRVDGYVSLLELLHSTPWFNSKKPNSKKEINVWQRKGAFMDAIFY